MVAMNTNRPFAALLIVALVFTTPLCLPALCHAAEEDDPAPALHHALRKCAEHADEWLEAGDLRSLHLAAGEAAVLGELLKNRSDDDAWQRACADVLSAARELQAAARADSRERSQAALQRLAAAAEQAAKLSPAGQPLPASGPAPGVRPLMRLVDGVYADAKVALLTGNVAEAKLGSRALAELAALVSNARTTDGWAEMAGDLREASLAAARSPADDKPTVRQLLRGINERCDACHNAQ
jgi:hypothetical protein